MAESPRQGSRDDRPPCERCGSPTYFFAGSGRKCENQVRYVRGRVLPPKCDGPEPVPEATTWTLSESAGVVTLELHKASATAGAVPIAVLVMDKEKAERFRNGTGFMAYLAEGGSCGCEPEESL